MRMLTVAGALVLFSCFAWAQQPAQRGQQPAGQRGQQPAAPAAPALPPMDPTKAGAMSAADFAAAVAKLPTDRNGNVPIFRLPPYNVGVEHRMPGQQQMAATHDREAELFYIIDGAGTIVTGGALVNPTRTNAYNWAGTAIKDGTSRPVAKGDFIMVPEGVPHWFSEIRGSLTQIALHLPRPAEQEWTGYLFRR